MKRQSFFKFIAVFAVSTLLLSGCGKPAESSEVVLQKFQQAVSELKSGNSVLNIKVEGKDQEQTVDLGIKAGFKFDQNDSAAQKADITVDASGALTLGGKPVTGALALGLRTVGSEFYAKLDKLEASDESVNAIKPFIAPYTGKWLHVAQDFIPENIRNISAKDEAALKLEADMKKLFAESKMITVVKEYGVEKLNGEKTYHYGVRFNEEGVRDYFKKVTALTNPEITEAEMQTVEKDLEEAVKALASITGAELWVGASDYLPYKASLVLTGDSFKQTAEQAPIDLKIELVYEGSDFNKTMNIAAPEGAEEFNPLSLLTGAASIPTGEVGTSVQVEGATMPVPTEEGVEETVVNPEEAAAQ